MKEIYIPTTGPPVPIAIGRPHARGMPGKLEVGSRKAEDGRRKLEVGSPKLEARSLKLESSLKGNRQVLVSGEHSVVLCGFSVNSVVERSITKSHKETVVRKARDPADVNIVVGFNQRKKHNRDCPGLQPHKERMWLKPELPRCILTRQLKQTAIHEATHPPGKGIDCEIQYGTLVRARDGTFLREKIPKPPNLNRQGEERTYTVNNRKTGLNGSDMEEDLNAKNTKKTQRAHEKNSANLRVHSAISAVKNY